MSYPGGIAQSSASWRAFELRGRGAGRPALLQSGEWLRALLAGLPHGLRHQHRRDSIMAKGKSGGSYRGAISGRYVTAKHGKASPRTTLKEAAGGGSTGSHRSAVSGRFVSERYAKTHPKTTVKES